MIKFHLSMDIVFKNENHFTVSHEDVEKFLLEKVNNLIFEKKIKIENAKVISSMESYAGEKNCVF